MSSVDGHSLPPWLSTVAAGLLIGVGLFQIVFGYKLFRATLFTLGFASAGLATFFATWDHVNDPNAVWVGLGLGVAAGLLAGSIGALVPRIGVFLVGGALGTLVGVVLNLTVFCHLWPGYPTATLVTSCVVLGLVMGGLANVFMRTTIIVATSVLGGYSAVRGVGFFAGNYPDEISTASAIAGGASLPVIVWAYLGGSVGLALIGICVQFFVTARRKTGDEVDEWEREYANSEVSFAQLRRGVGEVRERTKGGKKGKKTSAAAAAAVKRAAARKKKKSRAKKEAREAALLGEYEEGPPHPNPTHPPQEYYDEGYDQYYEGGGEMELPTRGAEDPRGHEEMGEAAPPEPTSGGRSLRSFFTKKAAPPAALEW